MSRQRFSFDHDVRFAAPLRLLGIRPGTCWVEVGDARLDVRFGRWRVRTPLANIAETSAAGPFKAYRAIGPRLSLADRGLTLGTTPRAGVCLQLHEPVGVLFGHHLRHPNLTVTVADPQALVATLRGMVGGQDGADG